MTPAKIKKTKLYRALAKAVRKEDHAELARQLALVPDKATAGCAGSIEGMNSGRLTYAFSWRDTPQGWGYWATFATSLRRAGHGCH